MQPAIGYIVALVVGYLLGSIPFGLVFTRLAGMQDIRAIGSGSIGATNVLRTGRIGLAAATLIADVLKGTAAVLLVTRWSGHDAGLIAGLGAFLGHLFPLWLKFKGGKGIATGLVQSAVTSAHLGSHQLGPAYRDVVPLALGLLLFTWRARSLGETLE